jgi:hypothetical protein
VTRITRYLGRHAIAFLALFVALGGTTYAATGYPASIIGAKQLKKSAVTGPKIKNNAVTSAKAANDSLTGVDVSESSLGKVPSAASADQANNAASAANATSVTNATQAITATHATNVDRLGGSPPSFFQDRMFPSCTDGAAITFGPGTFVCSTTISPIVATPASGEEPETGTPASLNLQFRCHSTAMDLTRVDFHNGTNTTVTLNWIYSDGTTVNASGVAIAPFGEYDVSYSGKRIEGQFIYADVASVTTVKLHAYDGGSFCEVRGTAVYAGS